MENTTFSRLSRVGVPEVELGKHYNPATEEQIKATREALENTPTDWKTMYDAVVEVNDLLGKYGNGSYCLIPDETLLKRAETVYNRNSHRLREILITSGVSADTILVVLSDYVRTLTGIYEFAISPEQLGEVLEHVAPYKVFNLDRYGLYFALFCTYRAYMDGFTRYLVEVKNDATPEQILQFFRKSRAFIHGAEFQYLKAYDVAVYTDFTGVAPDRIKLHITRLAAYNEIFTYIHYSFVAKHVLLATPEELTDYETPAISPIELQIFADKYDEANVKQLDKTAEVFDEFCDVRSKEQFEETQEAANDWNNKTNSVTLLLPEATSNLNTRPVEVSPNGKEIIDTLPIQRYLDDFISKNPQYGNITEMTVQKIFDTIGYILAFNSKPSPDGQLTIKTNISEFCENSGYDDANNTEKKAVLGGLLCLNNLYVILHKPFKYIDVKGINGKVSRKKVGGLTAINVIRLREIGLETGDLVIDISPDALKGKPTIITQETYKQLRAEAKGLAQSRFNFQLLEKGHKAEDDLVDEIWGFGDMLKYATPEDMKKTLKYVRGHRAAKRKTLRGWFDEYSQKGYICYSYNERTRAYKWERIKPVTPEEKEKIENLNSIEKLND